jgi:hypothetical protein
MNRKHYPRVKVLWWFSTWARFKVNPEDAERWIRLFLDGSLSRKLTREFYSWFKENNFDGYKRSR